MKNTHFYEEDFNDFLQQLVDSKQLEPIQDGITKFVIGNSYDKLSLKQKKVFDYMIDTICKEACKYCESTIPWCEMFDALDNGGYCSHCQNMMEKLEKE